jgi:hypothetical protein
MKKIITFCFIVVAIKSLAQIKLEAKDVQNLVEISELYSKHLNNYEKEAIDKLESLRTPKLNSIVETLLTLNKKDTTILNQKYWKRPTNEVLMMWYVIRELHYNNNSKEKSKPRTNDEVANEVLSQKIDNSWLLDNYYYRIQSGVAWLFNKADLSMININLDSLGLLNQTEKGICYLNLIESCTQRFKILQMLKKNDKIMEFATKMPQINGKDYFLYKDFDFPDFKWIGYEKEEMYNVVHINNLYQSLFSHLMAIIDIKGKKEAQNFHKNSILSEPKFFKYAAQKDDLQMLYERSKH